ncbi:MAG: FkbM family methyltransferase [Promethearchaeota archaeon]
MNFIIIISKILPECLFKEHIRKFYYQLLSRKWSIGIKKIKLFDDKVFFELENGLMFLGISNTRIKWQLFNMLNELLTRDHDYEKYYKLKAGDIIVDAGAGPFGVFTIFASKIVGATGLVIAIEPEKNNLKNLKENIKINNLENVIVVSKGLWNKKLIKKLYIGNNSFATHSLSENSEKLAVSIELDTLDNILTGLDISKVNFVKMDIEGAEIQALDGMKRLLKTNDLNLAIAAYHMVDGKMTYKKIIPKLEMERLIVRENNGFVYASTHKEV